MFVLAMIISAIVPFIVILCGYFMKEHTPEEINSIIGYRTKRSMSSPEAWEFANKLCGDMWIKGGLASLVPSLALTAAICFLISNRTGVVAAAIIELVQAALIFLPVYYVEQQLKKKFEDKNERNEE